MSIIDDIVNNHPLDIADDGFQEQSLDNTDSAVHGQSGAMDDSGSLKSPGHQHVNTDTDGDGQPDIHQSMVDQNHDGHADHFVQYVDVDHPGDSEPVPAVVDSWLVARLFYAAKPSWST